MGSQAMNAFYVVDASGDPVQSRTIEAVRSAIGERIIHVIDDERDKSPSRERVSFGTMIRSRSEKFLFNLGLIRSCS